MRRWVRSLPPTQRLAFGLWFLLILCVTVRVAIESPWKGSVVGIYLHAADRWLAGEDVYLWQAHIDLYRNPPGVTPLLVPLTLLPPKTAGILWRLASVAVFLLGLRAWLRDGFPTPFTPGQRGAIFALTIPLTLASLNNGQTNLILTGFLLFGTAAAARSGFRAGGLLLAVAAGIKLYPAAVGLLLAAASPRRVLPWFLAGFAAFLLFPFLCQRPDYVAEMYRSFTLSCGLDDRSFAEFDRAPQDVFLLLRVWAVPPSVTVYQILQLAVAAGMAGFVGWCSYRGRSRAELASLALHLGCVWMTAFGPASEGPTYTLLGPSAAAVLVLAHRDRSAAGGRARFALALLASALLYAPIIRDAFPNGGAFRALGTLPAGALVLLVVIVLQARRQGSVPKGVPVILEVKGAWSRVPDSGGAKPRPRFNAEQDHGVQLPRPVSPRG